MTVEGRAEQVDGASRGCLGKEEQGIDIPPLPVFDESAGPAFSPADTAVVFVLGGPGVGKGTQCQRAVEEFSFVHLSAGDLLREERAREASPYAGVIEYYIREGKIIPQEITISLLLAAMRLAGGSGRFLIDGFPRTVEQGILFEKVVCPSSMVLFYECSEDEMLSRLMARSVDSGRTDDNPDTIRKRFRTFQHSTIPVREHYRAQNKLYTINCSGLIKDVYEETRALIRSL